MSEPVRIPLTRGLFALVDQCWAERLPKYSWQAVPGQNGIYYAGTSIRRPGGRISILMHRVILGVDDSTLTSWINGSTLDNRVENLRATTVSEARGKRSVQGNNSSGFKGVHLKGGRYWIAQIKIAGSKQHVGCFGTAQDAAKAYDQAALHHFGDLAFLNFPDVLAMGR